MGLGTEHAPAQPREPQPYTCWEIDVRLFDDRMQEIDAFSCRQDVYAAPDQFFVRLTRTDGKGVYEDRGAMKDATTAEGKSGFGGRFTARVFQNGALFTQGTGGDADFIMLATPTGPDHVRCFRRFEVGQPTTLWGKQVEAGIYFCTTEDQMVETRPKPPAELMEPLVQER